MKEEKIKHMNELYHLSQERDLSPEEFDEYNAFCDACKAKAKEIIAKYDEA